MDAQLRAELMDSLALWWNGTKVLDYSAEEQGRPFGPGERSSPEGIASWRGWEKLRRSLVRFP
jgi:hypothetical protein